jgi:hypothetical protein
MFPQLSDRVSVLNFAVYFFTEVSYWNSDVKENTQNEREMGQTGIQKGMPRWMQHQSYFNYNRAKLMTIYAFRFYNLYFVIQPCFHNCLIVLVYWISLCIFSPKCWNLFRSNLSLWNQLCVKTWLWSIFTRWFYIWGRCHLWY